MATQYDYMVYVGRFQPAHNAHIQTIREGLKQAERVIVVIGSAFQARTFKDPWTWKERATMIANTLTSEEVSRIDFCGVGDEENDDRWARTVQEAVFNIVQKENAKIGIIGLVKDASSFYLSMFPQWQFVSMPFIDEINATDIRTRMFEIDDVPTEKMHYSTVAYLEGFMKTEIFKALEEEYFVTQKYRQSWARAPYAPTFLTADAVVIQSGHLLVIRRKAAPGKNLLALPGGFVGQTERLVDASIRELREETKLKVPAPVLKGSIKYEKMYDKPSRSLRGRTVTTAFLYELTPGALPKVKGSDDAKEAFWMPLSEVDQNRDQFFEDHYQIIQDMLGKL